MGCYNMGSIIKKGLNSMKNKGVISTFKMVRFYTKWQWIRKYPKLINLLNRFAPYPTFIEIEVTTVCGLRCLQCEHTYWHEPNTTMKFEQFKGIVDQFPSLDWVGLTGIGESFIVPDFIKMLQYVKAKHTYIELYDNFYFVNEEKIRALVDMGVDKILFSFDAATKETYEKLRVNANFDRVLENIKTIYRIKADKKTECPELAFHFVITKLNMNEIVQYVELVHSIAGRGASIQFSKMLHPFKEIEGLFVEVPKETIELAQKKANELGINIYMGGDAPPSKLPIQQCIEWAMPFIFANGDVISCCETNEANQRDFQKAHALGNVFRQPFKEIWKGEKYAKFRKQLRNGQCPAFCANCVIYEVKKGGKYGQGSTD